MVSIRFHLPVLLSTYSFVTSYLTYNSIRLSSIYLLFFSQIIVSSSSKPSETALDIVKSIDDYLCQNTVFTCIFRQRFHESSDGNEQEYENCKYLLILHSCLHHDIDTTTKCPSSTLNHAQRHVTRKAPKHCFTSSVYENFYAQHLRSISSARTTIKCQIFILLFLVISFVIRIRVCC